MLRRAMKWWSRSFVSAWPRGRRRRLSANSIEVFESRVLLSSPAARPPLVIHDSRQNLWITAETTETAFSSPRLLGDWASALNWKFVEGDFNGDGRGDVLGRAQDGRWKLALNLPTSVQTARRDEIGLADSLNWSHVRVGDFDGDGKDDVAGLTPGGEWWIGYSRQDAFQPTFVSRIAATGYYAFAVADFNQDGKDDIANLQESGAWWITQSTGDSYRNVYYGSTSSRATSGWSNLHVWDADGDHFPDLLMQDATGLWQTSRNNRAGRFTNVAGNRWSPANFQEYFTGDFNGDGRDDIAGRTVGNSWTVNFTEADGTMTAVSGWGTWGSRWHVAAAVADYNLDGRDDVAGWFPEQARFWVQLGTDSTSSQSLYGAFQPAFAPVQDNPLLPRMLLIGDSISVGYTPTLRDSLRRVANVHRTSVNSLSTQYALSNLNAWLGKDRWDFIVFNFGLHDIKYTTESGALADPSIGFRTNDTSGYQANLELIVQRLRQTGAELIWANTTFVPAGSLGRVSGDEVIFNDVAQLVMQAHGIDTIDLHSLSASSLSSHQFPNDVHFKVTGSVALGRQVAAALIPRIRQLVVYPDNDY